MAQNQHSSDTPVPSERLQAPVRSSLSSTASPSSARLSTEESTEPDVHTTAAASPPHALDGSQFHNVIEEQSWSELPPTPEEQMPRRAYHHDQTPGASADREQSAVHEPAQISVGPA